jgi:hypothetical protein
MLKPEEVPRVILWMCLNDVIPTFKAAEVKRKVIEIMILNQLDRWRLTALLIIPKYRTAQEANLDMMQTVGDG